MGILPVTALFLHPHVAGTADRGVRVTEDIKRALTNNNASPKHNTPVMVLRPEEESSDTQSMELESPRRKGHHSEDDGARYSAFPRESDHQMLLELMGSRPRPQIAAQNGEVMRTQHIQVKSRRFSDSDSSTDSGSAPSSPQFSRRTGSTCTVSDSLRSSIRSSSAPSSDGRITMVTDYISQSSDFDTYSLSTVSMQGSPNLGRNSAVSLCPGASGKTQRKEHSSVDKRSMDSAIEQPSHSSQFDSGEEPGLGVFTIKVQKGTAPSSDSSSDTEQEDVTERFTQIHFKKVSPQKSSPQHSLLHGCQKGGKSTGEQCGRLWQTRVQTHVPFCRETQICTIS